MPDLTTLAAVKEWQGALAQANTRGDELLQALITSTSADFLRAIGRLDLLENQYVENRVGDGSSRMVLRHWPVLAITSLAISGSAVAAQTGTAPGWYLDMQLDPERRYVLYLLGQSFTDAAAVQLTYVAGYAQVPQDIAQAVTEWVVYRYTRKAATGQKQARGVEGERVEFEDQAMPLNTQLVVERYKREWPTYGITAAAAPGAKKAVSQKSVPPQ